MTPASRGRGQAHTLEAVTAALLLIASIGIALQMTAVTPLSASTSSQHLENQLKSTSEGVLASAAESGGLRDAVLSWNESAGEFHGVEDRGFYSDGPPGTTLGAALNQTLDQRNVAYNVYVVYQTPGGGTERKRLVYSGQPSDHAVSAGRTVTLTDDDHLLDDDGDPTATTVADSASFFVPETGSGNGVYNHVRVEVVTWRI